MKLTTNELKQLGIKKPTKDEKLERRIQILKDANGELSIEELQRELRKVGDFIVPTTIRAICQKNKIPYFKKQPIPHTKKKGAGIIIGQNHV